MIGRLKAALGLRKQTSPEMSRLAAEILRLPLRGVNAQTTVADYNMLLIEAKSLAGSVLSQDETK